MCPGVCRGLSGVEGGRCGAVASGARGGGDVGRVATGSSLAVGVGRVTTGGPAVVSAGMMAADKGRPLHGAGYGTGQLTHVEVDTARVRSIYVDLRECSTGISNGGGARARGPRDVVVPTWDGGLRGVTARATGFGWVAARYVTFFWGSSEISPPRRGDD